MNSKLRFGVFFLLFLAQVAPDTFFSTVLPVVLRQEGASLQQIGLLKLLALVYILKLVLAPYVDYYKIGRFGHYKTWIVPMQVGIIMATLVLATIDVVDQFALLMLVAVVWVTFASVQDVGVDGLTIHTFNKKEYAVINSLQTFAMTAGAMLGGGVVVAFAAERGFSAGVLVITCFLLLPILVLLPFKEKHRSKRNRKKPNPATLLSTFKVPGMARWLSMIALLIAGPGLAGAMVAPMLVDMGFELTDFAVLYGFYIPIIGVVATILTPLAVKRMGLRTIIILSSGFLVVDSILLLLIYVLGLPKTAIFAILGFGAFTNVFLLITLFTVSMEMCRKSHAATDWTIQASVLGVAGSLYGAMGAFIAEAMGYTFLFSLSLGLLCATLVYLARKFEIPEREEDEEDVPTAVPNVVTPSQLG